MAQANLRSIGIMSGTSGDGADALLLALDDLTRPHLPRVLAAAKVPFAVELQAELMHPEDMRVARLCGLQVELAHLYAQAVRKLDGWQSAACVGMHGQTLAHQLAGPGPHATLQAGSSATLAALLGLPVVGDLRAVDVALGGQGAPLVPFCHWFFLADRNAPTLVVNLGGICNVTGVFARAGDVFGYDVGPGMMLSDAWARRQSGGALFCDQDGQLSQSGRSYAPLLARLLTHPFVLRQPPKSCGREEFGRDFAEALWATLPAHGQGPRPEDVAYTLLEATVRILHQAVTGPRQPPFATVILAGGGAYNPTLRRIAEQLFAPSQVLVMADGVLAPQHHEAAAMALIAARTLADLPSSLPQVTGATRAAVLGHVHRPPPGP